MARGGVGPAGSCPGFTPNSRSRSTMASKARTTASKPARSGPPSGHRRAAGEQTASMRSAGGAAVPALGGALEPQSARCRQCPVPPGPRSGQPGRVPPMTPARAVDEEHTRAGEAHARPMKAEKSFSSRMTIAPDGLHEGAHDLRSWALVASAPAPSWTHPAAAMFGIVRATRVPPAAATPGLERQAGRDKNHQGLAAADGLRTGRAGRWE